MAQQLSSPVVPFNLTNNPPQIVNFQAVQVTGNIWTLSGQVQDACASGLVVTFGGFPELDGQTVLTDDNGNFSFAVTLADGEYGTATAQTCDGWDMESNVAEWYINPA